MYAKLETPNMRYNDVDLTYMKYLIDEYDIEKKRIALNMVRQTEIMKNMTTLLEEMRKVQEKYGK